MENNNKSILYIPVNIRRRKEWIDGFGKEELTKVILWFFIGIVIGIVLFFIKNKDPLYIVFSTFFFSGCAFALTRKDRTNRSQIDKLVDLYKFSASTKIYDYKYHNIYEKKGGEEKCSKLK